VTYERVPLPGDTDFRRFLNRAFGAGAITAAERHERRLFHNRIIGSGPPAGEAVMLLELDELAARVTRRSPNDDNESWHSWFLRLPRYPGAKQTNADRATGR
jgi:hypothetical protein